MEPSPELASCPRCGSSDYVVERIDNRPRAQQGRSQPVIEDPPYGLRINGECPRCGWSSSDFIEMA